MWPGPGTEWGLSKWELLSRITYRMPHTLSSPLFPVHYWLSLSLNLFNHLSPFPTFHLFLSHLRSLSMLSHSVSSPTNFCPQEPPKDSYPFPPPLADCTGDEDRLLSTKRQTFRKPMRCSTELFHWLLWSYTFPKQLSGCTQRPLSLLRMKNCFSSSLDSQDTL